MINKKITKFQTAPLLNEDITNDKDNRFTAKKGLLYLLNNLSNGTFCPDIEDYFKKMKEKKVEEFRDKIDNDLNNFNITENIDLLPENKKAALGRSGFCSDDC